MIKQLKLILLFVVLTFLVGCSATGNVVSDVDNANEATLKSIGLMAHSNEDVNVVDYNEVELFLTNGGFSPAVIEAQVGQTIVVTSYYVDDVHFSISELGVEEMLDEADNFEFVVEEKGEFPFICMDCSPMIKGLLVVE